MKFFDLFAGIGGFRLAFELEGYKCVGFCEIDQRIRELYKAVYDTEGEFEWDDVRTLPLDDVPDFDVLTAGIPCFPEEQLILTTDGVKRISRVNVGDYVITHNSNFKKVTAFGKRKYEGELVLIKTALNNIPFKVTPNHPIYAVRGLNCSIKGTSCYPTCNSKYRGKFFCNKKEKYRRFCRERYKEYKPEWIEAGDLRKGKDFVIIKFPKEKRVPSNAPLSPSWWYLFGVYIAEGTPYMGKVYKSRKDKERGIKRPTYKVYFSTGYKTERRKRMLEKIKKHAVKIGLNPRFHYHSKSTMRIIFYSKQFYEYVMEFFGKYSHKKNIPAWIFSLPEECIRAFLEGIQDGDGDKDKLITTVNPYLAYMVWLISLSLKIPASIKAVKCSPQKVIEGRTVNQSEFLYSVYRIKRKDYVKVGKYWFINNGVVLAIKDVKREKFSGYVYNLEVEGDHSYTMAFATVHNCQPFSLAGRREGLKDGRAYPLWSAMFRLIERKRPALCVFENVKGLLSANRGWAFAYLLYKMDSLGYDGEWAVLNSKAFGVPQNRERLFVIFHLRGKSAPKVFPLRESDKVYYKPPKAQEEIHKDSEIAGALTSRHYTNWEGNFVYDPYNGRFKEEQIAGALRTNYSNGNSWIVEKPLQVGYVGKTNSQANRVFSPEGIAPTLLSGGGGRGAKTGLYGINGIKNGKELKIRRLTPLECFRLQGFPDWVYQKARKTGASDSLLYRAIGNAITVQVGQTIARKLKKDL